MAGGAVSVKFVVDSADALNQITQYQNAAKRITDDSTKKLTANATQSSKMLTQAMGTSASAIVGAFAGVAASIKFATEAVNEYGKSTARAREEMQKLQDAWTGFTTKSGQNISSGGQLFGDLASITDFMSGLQDVTMDPLVYVSGMTFRDASGPEEIDDAFAFEKSEEVRRRSMEETAKLSQRLAAGDDPIKKAQLDANAWASQQRRALYESTKGIVANSQTDLKIKEAIAQIEAERVRRIGAAEKDVADKARKERAEAEQAQEDAYEKHLDMLEVMRQQQEEKTLFVAALKNEAKVAALITAGKLYEAHELEQNMKRSDELRAVRDKGLDRQGRADAEAAVNAKYDSMLAADKAKMQDAQYSKHLDTLDKLAEENEQASDYLATLKTQAQVQALLLDGDTQRAKQVELQAQREQELARVKKLNLDRYDKAKAIDLVNRSFDAQMAAALKPAAETQQAVGFSGGGRGIAGRVFAQPGTSAGPMIDQAKQQTALLKEIRDRLSSNLSPVSRFAP